MNFEPHECIVFSKIKLKKKIYESAEPLGAIISSYQLVEGTYLSVLFSVGELSSVGDPLIDLTGWFVLVEEGEMKRGAKIPGENLERSGLCRSHTGQVERKRD